MISNYIGYMSGKSGTVKKALLALFAALLAVMALAPQAWAQAVPVVNEPPQLPHDVVSFPERDFVVADGFDANTQYKVEVIRKDDASNDVVIGTATGTTDGAGFLEVNHPGGVCWDGKTPDILPQDRIVVTDDSGTAANGNVDSMITANVTAEAVFVNEDTGNLEVHGTARQADGSRIPLDLVEQRIINPDLVDTAVGRRDMRATSDGAGLGTISYDGATGNKWTAIYTLAGFTTAEREEIKTAAIEGQTRIMSWMATDADANRLGITIFEVNELGGPGFGGCAAGANYGVTDFGRDAINNANKGDALSVTGSSFDTSAVAITLDDENPNTQAVNGTISQQPDPATGHQTWKASFAAADVQSLDDGMLTASGTYTIAGDQDPITGAPTTRKIKGADRQLLKDVVEPGSPSATPSGAASYPTWQSVKLSKPAGEDRLSKIHYTTNGSVPSLASRMFGETLLITDDQTIRARIVDRAGNIGPIASFAYDIQLAPGTSVDAPPRVTQVNSAESNATGISTPPAFPRDLVIFPERDFVVADGYEPFKHLNFKVVRNGHVVGTASGTTDKVGFLEVNHPGGVCWNGVTPDIQPGDEVFVTDTQGNGDKSNTINVTAEAAQEVGDTIVVHGTAKNATGGQIDLALFEQRIVQPEFRSDPGSEIGRRDIRADANGGVVDRPGGSGQLSYDAPGSTNWTAVYTGLNQRERELALEGQTRVLSWLAADAAANRLGVTIFEVGETGGPGFGGCPNAATFAATGANHTAVNQANQDQSLEISGVSDNASAVAVKLTDDKNSSINADNVAITPAPNALHPNAQVWKATFTAAQVNGLGQGTLTASGTYTVPVDLPTVPATTNDIPGVEFEILKDTVAPDANGLTATPNANTAANPSYPIWQAITLEHADDLETAIHFTLNGNDPTPNSRFASSQVVLDARTEPYVLKALAIDSAGNKSTVRSFDYKIVDGIAPGQPGALDLVDASDTGDSNTDNLTNDATPTFSGTAEARSNVKLFKVTGTGATETLTQVGNTTAGDDGKYSVTASTLSGGDHNVLVTATDVSGNVSARSATLSFKIDTTVPTVSAAPGAGTYPRAQSITLNASEAAKIYFTRNNTAPNPGAAGTFQANGAISITSTTTLKFLAIDPAGNRSAVRTALYTIRNSVPTITAIRPTGTIADRTPLIAATINDTDSNLVENNITLSVDGRNIARTNFVYNAASNRLTYQSPQRPTGKHTVRITVRDVDGGTTSRNWSFTIR